MKELTKNDKLTVGKTIAIALIKIAYVIVSD